MAYIHLAHARGLLSGQHYALALLMPANLMRQPKCPYWCPLRKFSWHIGFSTGLHQILSRA